MADLLEISSTNINNLMKSRGENIKKLSLSINTPYTSDFIMGKYAGNQCLGKEKSLRRLSMFEQIY